MAAERNIAAPLVLLAIRLVQPGRLADILEGISRLSEIDVTGPETRKLVSRRLEALREGDFICLYTGQRYMLLPKGSEVVETTGIKLQIDHRRMYLLKETRRGSPKVRSGARDGSLQQ